MSEWLEAATLEELQRRKKIVAKIRGLDIVLFFAQGNVFAMADVCIHEQRRLSQGIIFRNKIVCPGHQWAFDLATGWVEEQAKCQPTYAVKVEDGKIFVDPAPRVHEQKPACFADPPASRTIA